MKKFFLLASVAVCFAACSSENEELENNAASEITRSTCYDFTTSSFVPCSTRGTDCVYYQKAMTTNPEYKTHPDHYHCRTTWCQYYNDFFFNVDEAWDHCNNTSSTTPGNHGGTGVYE